MKRLFKLVPFTAVGFVVLTIGFSLVVAPLLGVRVLSVQSGSMHPAIEKGHAVIVNSVPNESLKVGDVITFRATNQDNAVTVTHRVLELPSEATSGRFITKGDANSSADEPIAPEQITGRVDTQVPLLGSALDFVTTPAGLVLLIYIPALYVVIDELIKLNRYFERNRPWRDVRLRPRPTKKSSPYVTLGILMAFVVSVVLSAPVMAGLQDKAQLVGTSISAQAASLNDSICHNDAGANATDDPGEVSTGSTSDHSCS